MSRIRNFSACVVLCTAANSFASVESPTYRMSGSASGIRFNLGNPPEGHSFVGTLPAFDTNLGSLKSAKATLDAAFDLSFTLKNNGTYPIDLRLLTTADLYVFQGAPFASHMYWASPSDSRSLTVAVGETLTDDVVIILSAVDVLGPWSNDPNVLEVFKSNGPKDLSAALFVYSAGDLYSEEALDYELTANWRAHAEGTITYTYDPVPEPVSGVAIGLGTFVMVCRRRH